MKLNFSFKPRLGECLKDYSAAQLRHDALAGLNVLAVAFPLSLAFGIASGVKPEQGLFTAVIAGCLISLLSGSRVQIGGPTGAFVVITYSIIQQYGVSALFLCTMLAGIILVIMGLARLGAVIKFIPYPVSVGFTNGIAILILGTQIKDFFGLQVGTLPAGFIPKMQMLASAAATWHWPALLLAVASTLLIALWPRRFARILPGSAAALIVGALVVTLGGMDSRADIATIGSQFGELSRSLPAIAWPRADWSQLQNLFHPALTIALLVAMQALLCAVVSDGLVDDRHDSNQELMSQGVANFIAPLFGCIPATGGVARTIINVRSGGRTPVAGAVHSLGLLILIWVAAPLMRYVPLASLSAVLVMAAYNMGDWQLFSRLNKWPGSDAFVYLTAFSLTVLVDLTVAVEAGVVLAALLFMKRISETTQITAVDERTETELPHHSLIGRQVPEGVLVYRIFGAFFFGAADKLENELKRFQQEPEVLILRMRKVVAMDATGLNALESLHTRLRRKGKHLILSGPHTQPFLMMENAGFLDRLGRENVCPHIDAALARSREILRLPPAPPADVLQAERARLELVRQELATVLEKVHSALQPSPKAGEMLSNNTKNQNPTS